MTGASSGIGRAIALDLSAPGAEICLLARRRDALESVAKQVRANGGQGHVFCVDFACDQDIEDFVKSARAFDHLDVLVLCGGAIFHANTEHATIEQFDLQYRSNVRGPYSLVQALLPLLRKQSGQIVFVNSSLATRRASCGNGQFTATQCALRAIADSLRDELQADGIRVLSVYPGRTATPRTAELYKQEGRPYHPELLMQPEDVATMVTHALRMPRTAEVTDISMRSAVKSY